MPDVRARKTSADLLLALAPRLAHARVLRMGLYSYNNSHRRYPPKGTFQAVFDAVNAGHLVPALCELRLPSSVLFEAVQWVQELHALLAVALTRVVFHSLSCSDPHVEQLLLCGPKLQVLRLIFHPASSTGALGTLRAMRQTEGAATLSQLVVCSLRDFPELVEPIIDVTLAHRLVSLELRAMGNASVSQLARLLREGTSLRRLKLDHGTSFDAAGVSLFADALRDNTTLEFLCFNFCNLCRCENVVAGAAVCAALVGHPSIATLTFRDLGVDSHITGADMLDESLAALLLASSSALTSLSAIIIPSYTYRGVALPRFMEALARNTQLRSLAFNGLSQEDSFLQSHLRPALRANTSLRQLGNIDMFPVWADIPEFCALRLRIPSELDDVM